MSKLCPTQKDFLIARICKKTKELENCIIEPNGCIVYWTISPYFTGAQKYESHDKLKGSLKKNKNESIWLHWVADMGQDHMVEVPWGLNYTDKKINGCLRYTLHVEDSVILFFSNTQLHNEKDDFSYLYDFHVDNDVAIGISSLIKNEIKGTITELVREFISNSTDPESLRKTLLDKNKSISKVSLDNKVILNLRDATVNIE